MIQIFIMRGKTSEEQGIDTMFHTSEMFDL